MIGVVPKFDRHGGGMWQYSEAMLFALRRAARPVDIVIVQEDADRDQLRSLKAAGWHIVSFRPPTWRTRARRAIVRIAGDSTARFLADFVRARRHRNAGSPELAAQRQDTFQRLPGAKAWLRGHGIDLLLFAGPSPYTFRSGVPYIVAVHDLQHRLQPEFPEVSANGEWEAREYLFGNAIRHAEAVLVDSEVGREDVLTFYGDRISPDCVRVLSFVPPPYLVRPSKDDVAARLRPLGLPDRYLLMPAQFWPHKNHQRVVEAVARLRTEHLDVTVVMTGAASGPLRAQTLTAVREVIARTGIDDLVRILGYVDQELITALYAGATGVVLPTFFGPTNIPVIEGWAMGIPVLTSDIRGIREQCGDAALLVDPRSTEAIADGIRRLWTDDDLRERLVVAGRVRLERHDPADFREELGRIIDDVRRRLASGETRVRAT